MLGLRQLGVVAHGRFTRRGFARAIEVAARGVEEDVIAATRRALEQAGALRTPARRSARRAAMSDRWPGVGAVRKAVATVFAR